MMKLIRRTAAAILAAVLLVPGAAAAPAISAGSALVMDADSGTVLLEHNADQRRLIASTTKIMTCLVALEHCDPEATVRVPPQAVGIEGSSIYLKADEQLPMLQLLYGMMLHSGNDAAMAIAMLCAGSVEEFVALMNLKAQRLGLENTRFANPSGLDDENNYSTARDLARLTAAALENPLFARIVSTRSIRLGERSFTNHNKLLGSLDGCLGVKTGYTRAAGRVLVSACQALDRRLIVVTIDDGNDWADHRALYDYGFACYRLREFARPGQSLGAMPMLDGSSLPLQAGQELFLPLLEGEEPQLRLIYPRFAFGPGEPGSFAALAGIWIGGRRIGSIRLCWGEREEEDGGTSAKNTVSPWPLLPPGSGGADPGRQGGGQRPQSPAGPAGGP